MRMFSFPFGEKKGECLNFYAGQMSLKAEATVIGWKFKQKWMMCMDAEQPNGKMILNISFSTFSPTLAFLQSSIYRRQLQV